VAQGYAYVECCMTYITDPPPPFAPPRILPEEEYAYAILDPWGADPLAMAADVLRSSVSPPDPGGGGTTFNREVDVTPTTFVVDSGFDNQ
jgi:hypothetical protein